MGRPAVEHDVDVERLEGVALVEHEAHEEPGVAQRCEPRMERRRNLQRRPLPAAAAADDRDRHHRERHDAAAYALDATGPCWFQRQPFMRR